MDIFSNIAITKGGTSYPNKIYKFRPSIAYPEYIYKEDISKEENRVYDAVRNALYKLELDKANYGTSHWNPLGELIVPGDTVLLKPNLVMHKNGSGEGEECLYTQPSVVAAVIDYVIIALKGKGKIIVGDAPMQECNFQQLIQESGYDILQKYYLDKGISLELIDFRELVSVVENGVYVSSINSFSKGRVIDLQTESEFAHIKENQLKNLRITNYNPDVLLEHHNLSKHEYYVSDYVLDADVIINLPKPKCHRKAGVTISLKNFVGINVRKEYLPHHTKGSVNEGGDEYERKNVVHAFRSLLIDYKNRSQSKGHYTLARMFKLPIRVCSFILKKRTKYSEGSWYGNNTISKTIADLNKIVLYADKHGNMQDKPQRKVLIIADMIIAGEKDGPVRPSPKKVGIIAAGTNMVCFDEAIAILMGFDISKIPSLKVARNVTSKYMLVGEKMIPILVSDIKEYDGVEPCKIAASHRWDFAANPGWEGQIESLHLEK